MTQESENVGVGVEEKVQRWRERLHDNPEMAKVVSHSAEELGGLLFRWRHNFLSIQKRLNAGLALTLHLFLGLAVIGVAAFTYSSVRDVIPDSSTIYILLLISFITGMGIILYGVARFMFILWSYEVQLQQGSFEPEVEDILRLFAKAEDDGPGDPVRKS